ncbi:hypothetical protein FRC02_006884 [Tulasnella sp. 418]|nr:hypothetical protein FRC02_006884 [Tulasnella sp. 418]
MIHSFSLRILYIVLGLLAFTAYLSVRASTCGFLFLYLSCGPLAPTLSDNVAKVIFGVAYFLIRGFAICLAAIALCRISAGVDLPMDSISTQRLNEADSVTMPHTHQVIINFTTPQPHDMTPDTPFLRYDCSESEYEEFVDDGELSASDTE